MATQMENSDSRRRPENTGSSDASRLAEAWAVASMPVYATLGGGLLGWLIDRWCNSSPTGLLVGLGVGVLSGLIRVVYGARRLEEEDDRAS